MLGQMGFPMYSMKKKCYESCSQDMHLVLILAFLVYQKSSGERPYNVRVNGI